MLTLLLPVLGDSKASMEVRTKSIVVVATFFCIIFFNINIWELFNSDLLL